MSAARTRFRDDLTEALLAGRNHRHSPDPAWAPPAPVAEAGSPGITRLVAAHRGRAAAEAAALEIGRRMQAVMDAIARCEGDAEACADPQGNPSLARAAEAARTAGAADSAILDAIALARAGESAWDIQPPQAADIVFGR